jgi:hypothetical protein
VDQGHKLEKNITCMMQCNSSFHLLKVERNKQEICPPFQRLKIRVLILQVMVIAIVEFQKEIKKLRIKIRPNLSRKEDIQ